MTDGDGSLQESGTRYLARRAAASGTCYLVIDIEGELLTVANCERVLAWVRDEKIPNLKISFWDVPFAFVGDHSQWAAFTAKLDFLTPDWYAPPDMDHPAVAARWKARVARSVAENRAFAPGKPIFPFICPRFVHNPVM